MVNPYWFAIYPLITQVLLLVLLGLRYWLLCLDLNDLRDLKVQKEILKSNFGGLS